MKSRGPIIAAAAGVLVSVLVAAGLILPKMGQVKKVQDQVTAAQAQTAKLTLQVNQLEDLASQAYEAPAAAEGAEHRGAAERGPARA